ncbi:MAG: hypothetical protein OXI59_01875 [Gemmatimonadota bacterium]|nr:hypothetical protein [Gemmatimonadota bacterium]MYD64164.1 hypothetical protein [Gemmatimonadota bacterium]
MKEPRHGSEHRLLQRDWEETLNLRYNNDESGLEQKLRSTSNALEQKLCSTLAITVPSLEDYHLDIVTVIYPYPLRDYYPLVLSDDLGDKDDELSECNSEQEFRDQLQKMLSSKRTTDTLKNLLSLIEEKILSDDGGLPF